MTARPVGIIGSAQSLALLAGIYREVTIVAGMIRPLRESRD